MTPFGIPALRRDMAVALSATLLVAVPSLFGWMTALERPLWDALMRVPRPGSTPNARMAAVLIDNRSLDIHGPLPWPRSRIAEVIGRVRAAGARAVVVDMLLPSGSNSESDAELAQALAAGPAAAAAVLAPDGSWILPLEGPAGREIAAHAHAEVESDGVLRVISSTKQAQRLSLPALSLVAAQLGGWMGSIQPGAILRPDYRTPPNVIPGFSAADVLSGRIDLSRLASRVVFVGVSASGAGDQFLLPVGDRHRPVPGVLVHASIASSIQNDGLLSELSLSGKLGAIFAIALTMQLWRTRSESLSISSLFFVLIMVPFTALLFLWFGGYLVPPICLLTSAGLSVVLRETLESRDARIETDEILDSLVHNTNPGPPPDFPRGVHRRLRVAKTLQQQLIHDHSLRSTLLEGLGVGVVLWDEGGSPIMHNTAVERLWGRVPTLDEVENEREGWSAEPDGAFEVTQGGRVIEVAQSAISSGRLALIRDVSERHELEQRRREMQRLVSHELKTPLASIAGFGEMLERYSLTEDELERTASMIRSEAERLGLMVKRFLDLERLGAGLPEQECTEVDLAALVRGRCEVLAASATGSGIELEVRAPSTVTLNGFPELLEELVDNLVGNALKYSPSRSTVAVEVRPGAATAILEVTDNGPGIPEQAIEHLFERFYRVPGASAPGTGLGLALVKEVSDVHRASVAVDSEVGCGSRFTVTFPRSEA